MKVKFILTAFLCLLILSSCNYFKNHRLFSKDADTVLDMTIEQPEELVADSSEYVAEEEYIEPEIEAEPISVSETDYSAANDKYFMVVASFQNQNLAKTYAEKIQAQGYQSQVLEASNGYFRVSAKSFSDYQQGLSEVDDFRNEFSSAWLYVRN